GWSASATGPSRPSPSRSWTQARTLDPSTTPCTSLRWENRSAAPERCSPAGVRIFAGLVSSPPDRNVPSFQLAAPNGTPLTRVRPAFPSRDALFGNPQVAADRFGNFV